MNDSSDSYGTYDTPDIHDIGTHEVGALSSTARHPVNITQLIFGIGFVAVVAIWGLAIGDAIDPGDARWLLPFPWLLAGAGGLLAWMISQRSSRE